jgi:hypothetical protein
MPAYVQTSACEFPGCDKPAPLNVANWDGDGPLLCLEHDAHLFYDPSGFRRMWEGCGQAARPLAVRVAAVSAWA